jgi:chemotaxis protein MotB
MAKIVKPDVQEEDSQGWLVSYADLMTLLLCFFILLVAMANFDPAGMSKKMEEISKSFNKDKNMTSITEMQQMQEEIAIHPELVNKLKVSVKDNSLVMTFSGSTLFDKGQVKLSKEALATLDTMIEIVKAKSPDFRVLVEGHTDNQPNAEGTNFSSAWALSGARAASVIERFEFFGFDPQKLVPVGLGDTKPLVPNEDDKGRALPENQRLNRRIIIKVLEPMDKANQIRLGFGIYFRDAAEDVDPAPTAQ